MTGVELGLSIIYNICMYENMYVCMYENMYVYIICVIGLVLLSFFIFSSTVRKRVKRGHKNVFFFSFVNFLPAFEFVS